MQSQLYSSIREPTIEHKTSLTGLVRRGQRRRAARNSGVDDNERTPALRNCQTPGASLIASRADHGAL
jgi:hypothetical protein